MNIEDIGKTIVDSAIKVHQSLGPGLLESTYQKCLAHELSKRGLKVVCEVTLPIVFDGVTIEAGYKIDMLVEDKVIIENKTVDHLLPVHRAQLLTYLKHKNCWLGYLMNWNTIRMKNGINRMVNGEKPIEIG
jgi:GxxExxY protein